MSAQARIRETRDREFLSPASVADPAPVTIAPDPADPPSPLLRFRGDDSDCAKPSDAEEEEEEAAGLHLTGVEAMPQTGPPVEAALAAHVVAEEDSDSLEASSTPPPTALGRFIGDNTLRSFIVDVIWRRSIAS